MSILERGSGSMGAGRPVALVLLLVLAVVVTLPASAQTPFALSNIGQRTITDDARMVGRGGWGMAVADSLNPGFKNLASLSSLRHLVLKFTAYGDRMESRDVNGERFNTRVFAPDVRVAGPVIKNRLALTAGLVVHRTTQYNTLTEFDWGEVWGDSVSGNEQFHRIGNRFRVPVGAALKIFQGLSVSGSVNIEGGSLKATVSEFFTDPSSSIGPDYQTNVKETYDEFHGTSHTLGILLDPFSWFQVGASWTPAHKVEADQKVTHFGVSGRALSTYTMQMPDEYRAGLQLRPFGRLRLGADGFFQPFSEFTGPDVWMTDMEDEYGLSAGLEIMKGYVRRGGMSNLPFRLGVSYRRWAYGVGVTADKAAPIEERTVSIGTGFPFRQNLGELDVAISYSMIGELEKNGLESEVWRLTISVTGLERWW